MHRPICTFLLVHLAIGLLCLPFYSPAQTSNFRTAYGSGYQLVDIYQQANTFFSFALDPPALCEADASGFPMTVHDLVHPGITRITDLFAAQNGDFHVAGEGANGLFLMQTNFALQPIWFRSYGGLTTTHAAVRPGNYGFILCGTASGAEKILVVRTNNTGVTQWTTTIDLDGQDEFPAMAAELNNGTVVVVGSVTRSGQSHRDAFVLQLDNGGAVLRAHALSTGHTEVPLSISENTSGGFLLSGYSLIGNEEKAFVASFDSACTPLWSRQIMPDSVSRASEMMGFGPTFTSVSEVKVDGDSLETRILIQQWNEIGALTYSNRLDGTGINRPKSLVFDGFGHLLCGQLGSSGPFTGFADKFIPNYTEPCYTQLVTPAWSPITYTVDTLVASQSPGPTAQTDSLPFLQPSVMIASVDCITIAAEPDQKYKLEVYPNPATDHFRLILEGVEGEILLKLRDIQGRKIWEQTTNLSGTGSNSPQQRFALPQGGQGIYFLEIISENGRQVKKILAQP